MTCRACKLIGELYGATQKTPREYWVMTELVSMIHGSVGCDGQTGWTATRVLALEEVKLHIDQMIEDAKGASL